jgi:penicillin amidase
MDLTWDELVSEKYSLRRPTTFNTIKLIRDNPQLSFFDIQSTQEKETAREVVRRAFQFGVEDIEDWRTAHSDTSQSSQAVAVPTWADYKDSYLTHLLRIEPMNIHIRHGGGRDIVNAHSRTHGPSWRMIVSLEKTGMKAWATYPGGQSGNPGSVHYTDMLQRWLKGEYFSLQFLKADDAKEAKNRVTLRPGQKN